MRKILLIIVLFFCLTEINGQPLHEPIIIGDADKMPRLELAKTSHTRKCLNVHVFVDRSVKDRLGIVGSAIVVTETNARFIQAYDSINVGVDFNITYLDTIVAGRNNSEIINNFVGTPFMGDVAHLYTFKGSGGIGVLNQLQGNYAYAVSTLQSGINRPVGAALFWNGLVSAHEVGHVIGSHHTHYPVWNGNNTPIDSCGFSVPMTPPDFGTIMSYCHLFGQTEFVFRDQVADRLHERLEAAGLVCNPVDPEPECDSVRTARIVMNSDPRETTWRWGSSTGGPYPKDSIDVGIVACATSCDTLFVFDSYGDGFNGECMTGYLFVDGVEYSFDGDSLVIPFCEPPTSIPCIDIADAHFYEQQYQPGRNRGYWIYAGGNTFTLRGNIWTRHDLAVVIQNGDILRFEYNGDGQGEIQGVAVSYGNNPFGVTIYNLTGTQNFGNRELDVPVDIWRTIEIPLVPGEMRYLWIINDKDNGSNTSESSYKNFCIVKQENLPEPSSGRLYNILGQPVGDNPKTGVYFNRGGKRVIIN